MLKVCEHKCNQCLFSKNRIVDKARMQDILKQCEVEGSYFICHKATLAEEEVVCKGFFDKYKEQNNTLRVCDRMGWLQTVKPETLKEI